MTTANAGAQPQYVGQTSDPAVVTIELEQSTGAGSFSVVVTSNPTIASNFDVTANGEALATVPPGGVVMLMPGVKLRPKKIGTATITVGAPPVPANAGAPVLKWVSWLLILQLVLGFTLVIGGAFLGMKYGTNNAVKAASPATSSATTTSTAKAAATTTPSTGATTTTGNVPAAPGGTSSIVPTTTADAPGIIGSKGGDTASTISLVQALALAVIATGATLLPTGAASLLAAKVKNQE